MESILLFPFSEYWGVYLGFTVFILILLAIDLGLFHRKAHEVSFKESFVWSIIWISLALIFNFAFYKYSQWKFAQDATLLSIPGFNPDIVSRQTALEFLTGYIVEKRLP